MFPPSICWRSYHHAKARWILSRPLAVPCGSLRVRRLVTFSFHFFLKHKRTRPSSRRLSGLTLKKPGDVLQAMQEQDGVLADVIREMREERGRKGGFDDSWLRERVEVLGPEVLLDLLRSAVSTAIVDS